MTSEMICPALGSTDMRFPALSRYDNETYVCPEAGEIEAGIPFMIFGVEAFPEARAKMKFARQAQGSSSPVIQQKAIDAWFEALKIISEYGPWQEWREAVRIAQEKARAEMEREQNER